MVDLRHMNSRLQLELATAAAEALSTISATPQQLVWSETVTAGIVATITHGVVLAMSLGCELLS